MMGNIKGNVEAFVDQYAGTAKIKYPKLGDLDNRDVLSHSFGI